MLTAKLYRLRPSTPQDSSSFPGLRRRLTASPIPQNVRPTPSLFIASSKKLRGRRRPTPRIERSTSAVDEEDVEGTRTIQGVFPDFSGDTSDQSKRRDLSSSKSEPGLPTGLPPDAIIVVQSDGIGREEERTGTPLRGLDVLKALQKAAALKVRNSRRGRREGASKRSGMEAERGEVFTEGDVRPLDIKEDWGPRLDALEKQIQELLEQQHD